MPPRRKITISECFVVAGSANATRVVTSWVPSAATPTKPAPCTSRRRVKPLLHLSFWSASRSATARASTRIAASPSVGPCRRSSSGVMTSPQRVVDGVEDERCEVLELAAEGRLGDAGTVLGAKELDERRPLGALHRLVEQTVAQRIEVG